MRDIFPLSASPLASWRSQRLRPCSTALGQSFSAHGRLTPTLAAGKHTLSATVRWTPPIRAGADDARCVPIWRRSHGSGAQVFDWQSFNPIAAAAVDFEIVPLRTSISWKSGPASPLVVAQDTAHNITVELFDSRTSARVRGFHLFAQQWGPALAVLEASEDADGVHHIALHTADPGEYVLLFSPLARALARPPRRSSRSYASASAVVPVSLEGLRSSCAWTTRAAAWPSLASRATRASPAGRFTTDFVGPAP